jgi:hypothetical protein
MRKVSSLPEGWEVEANFFFTALAAKLIADTTASSSLSESESDDSGEGDGEAEGLEAAFFALVAFFELPFGVPALEEVADVAAIVPEDLEVRVLAMDTTEGFGGGTGDDAYFAPDG